jgi:hypothetical protein
MSTDPFAGGESNPSLSFKDVPFGTSYSGTVVELPTLIQGRNFETGEPDVWPDGNPKMVVCVTLQIGADKWSLWAAKPSSMFSAIKAAQDAAGVQIAVGGTLQVTYTHDVPNKTNPKLNPAKQYTAAYTPPNAFEEPAQPAQPAMPAQPTMPVAPVAPADHAMAAPAAAAPVSAANPAETAKQLLAAGLPVDQVATATGLPATTVAALANLVAAGA